MDVGSDGVGGHFIRERKNGIGDDGGRGLTGFQFRPTYICSYAA